MVVLGISGLSSQKGHVRCALFEPEGWLEKAFRTAVAEVHGSTAVCRFKDVPAGRYAVAAFHDLDDDGELDKVLGIPTEPYCFSRDARGSFGPPSFDAASFRHSGPKTVERARMK